MVLLLASSLFLTSPLPLDAPKAEAFIVREGDATWLEDRYDRQDLWLSHAVLGRWMDDDARVFLLARFAYEPPAIDDHGVSTRLDYIRSRVPFAKRGVVKGAGEPTRPFARALELLAAPVQPAERGTPPRQMPRGFKDVLYWQGTNASAIICTFLPEKSRQWYLAIWSLAETDVFAERYDQFERDFLGTFNAMVEEGRLVVGDGEKPSGEREALRQDAHHSVTNYATWHWTDAREFTVLDDLPSHRDFIPALTNEFASLRTAYASTIPSPLVTSNVLCVARLYGSRDEYLDALEADGATNMIWSAAYWSPARRELVAYLPDAGEGELMKTFRHESFHQYLSYAASMVPASPWFNEGYAQYFEGVAPSPVDAKALAPLIEPLLQMDYREFYAGSDLERRIKYHLAHTLAYFIEKGAGEVRFEPFKDLKRTYMETLIRTQNMHQATDAAFGSSEKLKLFVKEWTKFWQDM